MKQFKLDQTSKITPGFTVPENYFDDFDDKILNQIIITNAPVISIFRKSYVWMTGIAAILVIALAVSMFNKTTTNESFTNVDYLSVHENLTTEDLAEFLTENDIQSLEKTLIDYDLDNHDEIIENL